MFYLVIFSVLLILGLLFYSIFKLEVYKKKSKILLNKLNKHLSKLKLETINYEHHIVSDEIKNNSNVDIINLWREFEESLVTHNDRIENTLDAEHFFNENTIASKVFYNDFLKGVPNLMVGLGVAFTFIGLVIGLSGLNIASDDIESLKSGIESIIGGAKVSFWSSIAGIISSIVFTSYHSISKNKLRSGINELQKLIDYKYPRTNPEKSLAEMREYSKETEMHLGALSETLGDKLQEAVRGVGAEISSSVESSLTNAIGPYMDKIANKAMNSSESAFEQLIEEFLDKIGEAGREQQKLIQETNKTLNDSLIDFNNKFLNEVSGLKDVIENLNNSYHLLEENLVSQFDQVVNNLATAVNDHSKSVDKLLTQSESIDVVLEGMKNASKTFEDSLSETKTVLERLRYSSELQEIKFNKTIESLEDIYNTNNALNTSLVEATEQMKEPFEQLNKEYSIMNERIQDSAVEITEKMNDVINNYFTQVQFQTEERMREWNNQTSAFSSSMLDVTNELNSVIDQIKKKNN